MKFLYFLFFMVSGCSETGIIKHTIEEVYIYGSYYDIYVEDTATVYIGDSGSEWPIWVDSITQPGITSGVDILWVIDPSGSMYDDKTRVLAGIQSMMNVLPNTNWRLMILSTDFRSASTISEFPLLPGDDYSDALAMYNSTIQGGLESGFDSVYEYIVNNTTSGWMRDSAALLIVFVSDEEEQSMNFSAVSDFTTWLDSVKRTSYIASIVNTPNGLCDALAYNIGDRYIDATNNYNGQVIDICSDDWSAGVTDVAIQISPYEFIDLTEIPIDPTTIAVFVNGAAYNAWHYSSSHNRVYFDVVPSENSLIEIAYYYDPNN